LSFFTRRVSTGYSGAASAGNRNPNFRNYKVISQTGYVKTSGTSHPVTQGRIPEKWLSQGTSQPNENQKKQGKNSSKYGKTT
jgi:hypothetical protein